MIKVAVVGIGNMGMNHVRAYSKSNVTLVAIADTNVLRGKEVSEKFGVPFFENYQKMCEEVNLDAVSVCVPTNLHYKVAKHFLTKGLNVLLEKPISTNVREARLLLDLAKKNKNTFLVGHIERFNPAVKKAKEIIDGGRLGDICAIMIRRVGGYPPQIVDTNISIDLAIHDLDIANYLMSSKPVKVSINKQKRLTSKTEDAVEYFMKYKNKASVYIQANWISPVKIRKLSITGTKGYMELDFITQQIDLYESNFGKFSMAKGGYSEYVLKFSNPDKISIPVDKKEPLVEEINYFLDSVKSKTKIDSEFAIDALKIAVK